MKHSIAAICILAFASAAFAHSGVKNPAVLARMDAMSAIGAEVKTLGQMAKGALVFDVEKAKAATAAIAEHAAKTNALFEAREDDPKSEAKPEIWENFADFSQKSDDLQQLAVQLSQTIESEADLQQAVASLGEACKACHKLYRE